LGMNMRFGRGGMLGGGVSTGRTVTDNCGALSDVSTTSAWVGNTNYCRQTNPWAGQTQIKFNGSYPLPWYGIQASAVFQNLAGLPIAVSRSYSNAEIRPSLGRDLGSCRNVTPCTGTLTINNLIEPFTMREDRLTQLDLRATKTFNLGPKRLQAMFDVYNVFNAATILSQVSTYSPGPTGWLRPTRILGGRLFKFGAQFDF
jgi:hypothetical protein